MKRLIQLEEAAMLAISIYGLYFFKAEWWMYILLLFGPDISMLGYLAGNKTGAVFYNLFHHKALAIILFFVGFMNHSLVPELAGIVLFGHSSMDRMFGYGLKNFEGFGYTHLGRIGKSRVSARPVSVTDLN